jgi:hypothetical protein
MMARRRGNMRFIKNGRRNGIAKYRTDTFGRVYFWKVEGGTFVSSVNSSIGLVMQVVRYYHQEIGDG